MNVTYEFIVEGNLDARWSQWFGGLAVTPSIQGKTLIRGPVRDQAELYGMLIRLRDMGLTLISVKRIDLES